MAPTEAEEHVIYNMDIDSMVRKVDVVIEELTRSQSQPISEFREADMVRIKSYMIAAESFLEWVEQQPELDLVKWHPTALVTPAAPEVPEMQNQCLRDIVMLWTVFRHTLVYAVSAQAPTGLTAADLVRARAILEKMGMYIEAVEGLGPIDAPETAQTAPMPVA